MWKIDIYLFFLFLAIFMHSYCSADMMLGMGMVTAQSSGAPLVAIQNSPNPNKIIDVYETVQQIPTDSFASSRYAYVSSENNLFKEKANNTDQCLSKCAYNPLCFHTYFKNNYCYYQSSQYQNTTTKELCLNILSKKTCINIDRYVSFVKNFKIAYDKEYQFKIRLLDKLTLKWIELTPLLKYYLKSNYDMDHMQYNSNITCYGYGDPHYRSFGGYKLDTRKPCSYTIATNNCSDNQNSLSQKFTVLADHAYAFDILKATFIRGVRIFYRGNTYTFQNFVQINGKNISLPYYSSDDKSNDKIFIYRYNKYITFDAQKFNVLYDGNSMVKIRADQKSTCGLCNFYSNQSNSDDFVKNNMIIDPSKNCV